VIFFSYYSSRIPAMAKSKAQKRKRVAIADAPSKLQKTAGGGIITPPPDLDAGTNDRGDATKGGKELEPTSLKSVVSEEELEITIETLTELARYPGLLKKKEARELRGAVWEFRKTCTVGGVSAGECGFVALLLCCFVAEVGMGRAARVNRMDGAGLMIE
jgi:hypothetical protein